MSIADELAQTKAQVAEYEQYLKAAYTALQSNGASLPEKCNGANLAGTIEESGGYSGVSLIIESTTGDMLFKNGTGEYQNYAEYFIYSCYSQGSQDHITIYIPAGYTSTIVGNTDLYKSALTSIYIDGTGATTTNRDFLCGGNNIANSFSNLQKFELKGLETVGDYLCIRASLLVDVTLHESLKTIGKYAFGTCKALASLKLPDSLETVGSSFCNGCSNLQELYVPSGCTPPTDTESLSSNNAAGAAYANGIVLKGPGAAAWKAALPDRTTLPYRKLILDPEWA